MKFTRREILTAFLGAPFALAACSMEPPRKFPEGEIVGQSVDLGHILRTNQNFQVPADNWQTVNTAIVGGGVAGLTAAWKFKRENFNDFVVLELEKEIGGTARSGRGDPVPYPWGAHYLPVPFHENDDLIEFLDEMSLIEGRDKDGELIIGEQYLCREPEERLFFKGRWYEGLYANVGATDEDKRQYNEFQKKIDEWVAWRDANGKRAFVVPVGMSSTDSQVTDLDKISFADWLSQNGFNSERLIWYCDYACRDDYGSKLEQTSAWAGLFYFCSRVRKVGVDSQPFITFPEGNGRFINHFYETVKENVRPSQVVVTVILTEKGVNVICLDGGTLRGLHCQNVVYAAPVFTIPFVVRGFRDDAPFAASEFQHNAWWVANLHLNDRPKPRFAKDFPLAWDNVFYDSPSLGYVTATHQKEIDYGPTILTYYYPMCGEQNDRLTLFNYDWHQMADVCLSDMSRAHSDISDLVSRIDIMRWGHAMISPRPGFLWGSERRKAMKPYRNIHFAHTDLSGVALFEEAFFHGLRAADEILADEKPLRGV